MAHALLALYVDGAGIGGVELLCFSFSSLTPTMTSLVLEPSSIEKLQAVEASVAVYDAVGNLIGYFHPVATPANVDPFECPVSEEELLHRARQGGSKPLADVLRDLESNS
jgi:hypothetical protein